MMKRNKFLALGLALVMALTLAACGNDAADSTPSPSATAGEENNTGSKTYQFTGKYEEDSANASMLNAAFLLNLNEDGTAVADRYMFDNYDDSDAATNPTYTASYMSGTWKRLSGTVWPACRSSWPMWMRQATSPMVRPPMPMMWPVCTPLI